MSPFPSPLLHCAKLLPCLLHLSSASHRPPLCNQKQSLHKASGFSFLTCAPIATKTIFPSIHQSTYSTPSPGNLKQLLLVYILEPEALVWCPKHFPAAPASPLCSTLPASPLQAQHRGSFWSSAFQASSLPAACVTGCLPLWGPCPAPTIWKGLFSSMSFMSTQLPWHGWVPPWMSLPLTSSGTAYPKAIPGIQVSHQQLVCHPPGCHGCVLQHLRSSVCSHLLAAISSFCISRRSSPIQLVACDLILPHPLPCMSSGLRNYK
jgi:hypothetical protein